MRHVIFGLALIFAAPAAASAQTQEQRDWCFSPTASDDQTVEGCTAIIAAGQDTPAYRAAALDNRAFAYNNKKLYDLAIADENQSVTLNPDSSNAYDNRGLAYYDKGLYDLAIADFDHALGLTPNGVSYANNANVYNNRGLAYEDKGEHDLAIADYNRALSLKPDYASAYLNRGLAYEAKGDAGQAISDYRSALRYAPDTPKAQAGLARLGAKP